MTLVTSPGPLFQIETSGAPLQTLAPLLHQHKILPAAQALLVAATPALVTGGVARLANQGDGVAKVTERRRGRLARIGGDVERPCAPRTFPNNAPRSWTPV